MGRPIFKIPRVCIINDCYEKSLLYFNCIVRKAEDMVLLHGRETRLATYSRADQIDEFHGYF